MKLTKRLLKRTLFLWPPICAGCYHRPMDGSMGSWDHMMGYGGYGGIVMWILLLVIIGVIVFVIFNRSQQNSPGFGAIKESPLDILKKRYAKGEIQKEDFERMKKDLEE